jgi:hypothetical protein
MTRSDPHLACGKPCGKVLPPPLLATAIVASTIVAVRNRLQTSDNSILASSPVGVASCGKSTSCQFATPVGWRNGKYPGELGGMRVEFVPFSQPPGPLGKTRTPQHDTAEKKLEGRQSSKPSLTAYTSTEVASFWRRRNVTSKIRATVKEWRK